MFKKIPINIVSAIVIFILVFAWIVSGLFSSDETSSSEIIANSKTVEKITVRASEFSSQDKTYYLTVRGRTEADKVVMIKPKTSSNISMVINPGQNVTAGELICLLDKENRLAGLNEANANKNKAQLQFDAIQTLANEGYRSENAVATAEAALKSAIARVEMAQNELDNIRVVAPFDGYVEDVFVEVKFIGQFPNISFSCCYRFNDFLICFFVGYKITYTNTIRTKFHVFCDNIL